jgi:hypothetical protein
VEAGQPSYICSPLLDSYHTIWFELHEELITAQPPPPELRKPTDKESIMHAPPVTVAFTDRSAGVATLD